MNDKTAKNFCTSGDKKRIRKTKDGEKVKTDQVLGWDDLEKIMKDNPQCVLTVDICGGVSYLNNEAVIIDEPWYCIDFNKFRWVPNDEFGIVKFEIR